MDAYLQKTLFPYQHLKIQLEEIISATNNFNDQKNCIGGGGFGKVYKGEVSHIKGRSMVAIKRLDPKSGQGLPEFLKEITMLSNYRHENLISLLGFCCEGREMILVYELGFHGSLDRHLNSPHLSWTKRLQICLDAAKGINYLHDPRGAHQRLIHCDIKSGNILLDNQWNAKVSDFGLSIMGSANEQHSMIVTVAAGTRGSSNGGVSHILVSTWIESYKKKILDDIIFKNPTIQPLDESALEIFSDIAYRCLEVSREDRPKMDEVVTELEAALETEQFSGWKPLFDYQEMTEAAEPPLNYESKLELRKLLSKGVFLNGGNTWFSLNKKAEHYEIISCGVCVVPSEFESYPWSSGYNSRFAMGTYHSVRGRFKARVKSQFLSPLIAYTVNLVFKFMLSQASKCQLISLKYKLQGEDRYSTSYFAYQREDGWWIAELYQFTSDGRIVDLDILFDGSDHPFPVIEVEGIEFRPLEKKEAEKLDTQPISYSYENWEEKLPIDYEDMLKLSKIRMQSTTKKELYLIFCRGFLINVGQEWFSLDKGGKKCHMLSAKSACIKERTYTYTSRLLPESRFGSAVEIMDLGFSIANKINYQLVSSQTTYACYLIYKLRRDQSRYEAPMKVMDDKVGPHYIYLVSPQTPDIRSNGDQNTTHNPVNSPNIKGLPQQRDNGWMEVQIWKFQTATTTEMIHMRLDLTTCGSLTLSGLIIEGIEFRPV